MKLAYFYAHAASNWGDLAINKGALHLFRHVGVELGASHAVRLPHNVVHSLASDISLEHIRVIPAAFDDEDHSNIASQSQVIKYLTDINTFIEDFDICSVDVIVLNSGEHLFETRDSSNIADLAWRLLPLLAGAHAGKPVIQLPATFGPFYTKRVTRVTQLFLSCLDQGAVREDLSAANVRNHGRRMPVILDPGFFGVSDFPKTRSRAAAGAVALIPRLEDFGLRAGARRSAFIRAKYQGDRYESSKAFQMYLRLAENILSTTSDSIHLIIQTWADRELIQRLYAELASSAEGSRVFLHDPADYDAFTGCLAQMEVVVTSRFHAAILALTQSVPVVGIYSDSHGHKMPGLFSMLGMPQTAIRLQNRETDAVVQEVVDALENVRSKRDDIYESVVNWRDTTRSWFREAIVESSALKVSQGRKHLHQIDQIRIDLLFEVHRQIMKQAQIDDNRNILLRLKNIEKQIQTRADIA